MTEIILAACAAVLIVDVLEWIPWNRKPFNCAKCLSGWFCLGLSISPEWWLIPFKMAAAMIAAIILSHYIRKLKP